MTAKSIIGVDAGTGKLMWQHSHTTSWDVHANTPIYDDGYLFCTSGYGTGSVKLKLKSDGQGVEEVWRNKELDSQFDAAVLLDGYVYGSGHHNRGWKCLDWETGALKYSARDLSKGNIIYADGMFICYTDKGRVGLVKPDPDEFKVISRFEVTQGTDPHWAHTVVADGRLFVRHGDALMVYSIAK